MKDILTPQEVFSYLQISKSFGYKLINDGILKSIRIGGKNSYVYRIKKTDLEEYIGEKICNL